MELSCYVLLLQEIFEGVLSKAVSVRYIQEVLERHTYVTSIESATSTLWSLHPIPCRQFGSAPSAEQTG